jgi:hypothetical protein
LREELLVDLDESLQHAEHTRQIMKCKLY